MSCEQQTDEISFLDRVMDAGYSECGQIDAVQNMLDFCFRATPFAPFTEAPQEHRHLRLTMQYILLAEAGVHPVKGELEDLPTYPYTT